MSKYEATGTIKVTAPGMRFGRLTAIHKVSSDSSGRARWLYECDCGNRKEIAEHSVKKAISRSCGCLRSEMTSQTKTAHGKSMTPEHGIWCGMKNRCGNPNNSSFKEYGLRGISVSPEWQFSFEQFITDMGKRPSPQHSLDRIDNSKGYSKENCRWASKSDQANNTRRNVYLTLNGETKNISQWVKSTGLSYQTIHRRKRILKWSDERSLTTPQPCRH